MKRVYTQLGQGNRQRLCRQASAEPNKRLSRAQKGARMRKFNLLEVADCPGDQKVS